MSQSRSVGYGRPQHLLILTKNSIAGSTSGLLGRPLWSITPRSPVLDGSSSACSYPVAPVSKPSGRVPATPASNFSRSRCFKQVVQICSQRASTMVVPNSGLIHVRAPRRRRLCDALAYDGFIHPTNASVAVGQPFVEGENARSDGRCHRAQGDQRNVGARYSRRYGALRTIISWKMVHQSDQVWADLLRRF